MNIDEAQKIKALVVDPMIEAVRAELRPLVARVTALEESQPELDKRVQKIEKFTGRLTTVYSGIIAAVTFLVHYAWTKIQHKFFS